MDLPNAGQPQPQQSGNGKGKGRPKDGAGAAAASHQDGAGDDSAPASAAAAASASSSSKNSDATQSASQDEAADGEICFICAEPIKFYSLAQCNHRTCHVCAVRLRALYKKRECTFCKVCVLVLAGVAVDPLSLTVSHVAPPHHTHTLSLSTGTE